MADTWLWDGHTWERIGASGPSGRSLASMAFDGKRDMFVLFGGETARGASDETWTFNGAWKLQSPAHRPGARWGAGIGYDPGSGLVVLYGGHVARGAEEGVSGDDTWTWNGEDWTPVSGADQPSHRDGPRLVTAGDNLLLVAGHDFNVTYYGDAWRWTGRAWMPADRLPRPPGRGSPTVAWSPSDSSLFLFGGTGLDPAVGPGNSGKPLGDAWKLRDGAWTQLTGTGPPPLPNSNAVWDPNTGAILVMLGINCPTPSGDAWSWDGARWSQAPRPGIPARWGAALAEEPDGHALLFGGSNEAGC